jgi:hypothetical protein
MFTKIKEFMFGKPTQLEVEVKAEAPYKLEVNPVVATAPVEEVKAAPVAKPQVPAKKQQTEKKAPAPKTEAKTKPRAPRKPAAK